MNVILLVIIVILLLKFVMTSHKAANMPQGTSTVNTGSCGSAGDNFTSGSGTVAGVSEPTTKVIPTLSCDAFRTTPNLPPQLPIHVTFPVAPPPIAIQTPKVATVAPSRVPTFTRPAIQNPIISRPVTFGGLPSGRFSEFATDEEMSYE